MDTKQPKVKTIEAYPNMMRHDVLETGPELPPEAIVVALGDSHPEMLPKQQRGVKVKNK